MGESALILHGRAEFFGTAAELPEPAPPDFLEYPNEE
jgi:hypothetical protein